MDPTPFLRGNPFPGTARVPYPRADPDDGRLPRDTWYMASFPVGVRLELTGGAEAVRIAYRARVSPAGWTEQRGWSFEVWRAGKRISAELAAEGEATVQLPLADPTGDPFVVYLPERLAPEILAVDAVGGPIEPAPRAPRWICYGDSIAAGADASSPALTWASLVARTHGLDVTNLGYSGAARGELPSAEQVARLDAAVISITHGTNCWNRIAHSRGMMLEQTRAFLRIVRDGHPATPIVVCTPVLRPEAEEAPNRLGATLEDLRAAMTEACTGFDVEVVKGRDLIDASMLADNVHPNDAGHRAIADALGPVLAEAAG